MCQIGPGFLAWDVDNGGRLGRGFLEWEVDIGGRLDQDLAELRRCNARL